jgi:hypothetical protein
VDVEVLVRVDVVERQPASDLPDLTDGAGLMRADQATLGLDLARNPRARRQSRGTRIARMP